MKRTIASEIESHYSSGFEKNRLSFDVGILERERVQFLLTKHLPPVPAKILDVGGAAGVHAYWLAKKGYEVHLIDISETNVRLAKESAPENKDHHLKSIELGDARKLNFKDKSFDAVLLFGPLYHLTRRKDRIKALKEARRVLKKKGIMMSQAISKYASLLDGMRTGALNDPEFKPIVLGDLETGHHINHTDKPEYFMDTFFHTIQQYRDEMKAGGFSKISINCVEGPFWMMPNFEEYWKTDRAYIMEVTDKFGSEEHIVAMSGHLMGIAYR